MRLRKEVRIKNAQEVSKTILIAMMRSRRQEQHMIRVCRQAFGELIAFGFYRLIGSTCLRFGVR